MRVTAELLVFGEFNTRPGLVEVFTPESVRLLVENTPVEDVPIYHGFPDSKALQDKYRDTVPKGVLRALVVTERGCDAVMDLTPEGVELLRAGGMHAADHGRFKKLKKGEDRYEIISLKSIGLIKDPCLPVKEIKI